MPVALKLSNLFRRSTGKYNFAKAAEQSFKDRKVGAQVRTQSYIKGDLHLKVPEMTPVSSREVKSVEESSSRFRAFFLHQINKIRLSSFFTRNNTDQINSKRVTKNLKDIAGGMSDGHLMKRKIEDLVGQLEGNKADSKDKFTGVSDLSCSTFNFESERKAENLLETGSSLYTELLERENKDQTPRNATMWQLKFAAKADVKEKLAEALFKAGDQSNFLTGKPAEINIKNVRLKTDNKGKKYYQFRIDCKYNVEDKTNHKYFKGTTNIEASIRLPVPKVFSTEGQKQPDPDPIVNFQATNRLQWTKEIVSDALTIPWTQDPIVEKEEGAPKMIYGPRSEISGGSYTACETSRVEAPPKGKIAKLLAAFRARKIEGQKLVEALSPQIKELEEISDRILTSADEVKSTADESTRGFRLDHKEQAMDLNQRFDEPLRAASDKMEEIISDFNTYAKKPGKRIPELIHMQSRIQAARQPIKFDIRDSAADTVKSFTFDEGEATVVDTMKDSPLSSQFVRDMTRSEVTATVAGETFHISRPGGISQADAIDRFKTIQENPEGNFEKLRLYETTLSKTIGDGIRTVAASPEEDLFVNTGQVMPSIEEMMAEKNAHSRDLAESPVLDEKASESLVAQEILDLCDGDKKNALILSHLMSQYSSLSVFTSHRDTPLEIALGLRNGNAGDTSTGKITNHVHKTFVDGEPTIVMSFALDKNTATLATEDTKIAKSFSLSMPLKGLSDTCQLTEENGVTKIAVVNRGITVKEAYNRSFSIDPLKFLKERTV